MKRIIGLVAIHLVIAGSVVAELNVASPFSSNMVLQRDAEIRVWGWDEPGTKLSANLAGKVLSTEVDPDGTWELIFPARPAGGPIVLGVMGSTSVLYTNILMGDVWICSGQSNMQWPLSRANDAVAETAAATYPQIRLYQLKRSTAIVPQLICDGVWTTCTSNTAASFSAVGYFFGRALHKHLGVPIGLINTSWGGTRAEAWTPVGPLRANLPEFGAAIDALDAPVKMPPKEELVTPAQYNKAKQVLFSLEDDLAEAATWAAIGRDDREWPVMEVPTVWEKAGLPGYDGMVWFRKTVEIPASWVGQHLMLQLGPVDEVDVTWFNGKKVGGTGSIRTGDVKAWDKPRSYLVPGDLVKAGKNVVAVRVIDLAGAGGLNGSPAAEMYISPVAEEDDDGLSLPGDEGERVSLAGEWKYHAAYRVRKPWRDPNASPHRPGVLYNAMIHPLVPYGVKGAIWYQGESNAGRAYQYRTLMPTMIRSWRDAWGYDFPFFIVQLANFMDVPTEPREDAWAELREAQAMTARNDPLTGLALAIDIGAATDIHPRNKQDVGKRLALSARQIAYGEDIVGSGPVFREMEIDADGNVRVSFDSVGGGLVAKGGELKHFALAGEDRVFKWADAKIDGETVVVTSADVPSPVAVRYAWDHNPEGCNLYNKAGLPAVPFRSDDWPGVTFNSK